MGKVHDALRRAEEERGRLGGAPGGPGSTRDMEEAPRESARSQRKSGTAQQVREARRARVMLNGIQSTATEEFRSLRARIQSIRRLRPISSLVVTSALPDEGKTTTATNLALSFGFERERETCLVDGDLRAPGIHYALPEPPLAGLVELLEADAKLEEALVQIPDTRLSVIAVRSLPEYPSELLSSRRMGALLEELQNRFDLVVIDAPPILGLPDTTSLVDLCDAVLLVVSSGRTSRRDVDAALERIDATKVVGAVFNRSESVVTPYGSD